MIRYCAFTCFPLFPNSIADWKMDFFWELKNSVHFGKKRQINLQDRFVDFPISNRTYWQIEYYSIVSMYSLLYNGVRSIDRSEWLPEKIDYTTSSYKCFSKKKTRNFSFFFFVFWHTNFVICKKIKSYFTRPITQFKYVNDITDLSIISSTVNCMT